MSVAVGEDPSVLPTSLGDVPSPALQINPIGSAYRSTSRLASFGFSVLAWGLAAGPGRGAGAAAAAPAQMTRAARARDRRIAGSLGDSRPRGPFAAVPAA